MEARERSIGELFSDLGRKASQLVQEEIALARAEMSTKVPTFGRSTGMIAGGGAIAYTGFLAIVGAAIIALHEVLPWWAAALLVGVMLLGIGYLLIQLGIESIKRENLAPRRTVASLRGYSEMPASGSAFSRQR